MKIKNTTPFLVGSKLASRTPPDPEMVFIVRATYALTPGAPLVPIEGLDQGFLTADVLDEGDEARAGTVLYPSDFADFKPAADVMLRGTCHVPGGNAASECDVGFGVGDFEKTLLVSGPREWQGLARMPLGGPGAPEPFVSQSLDYDYSYGGEGFPSNPVGRGRRNSESPSVELHDDRISRTSHPSTPAGFGPLNAKWAPRAEKVGKKYGKSYRKERAPYFSEDFDWRHFNAAPEDQQLPDYLRGDELLWFQNLHPDHSEFEVPLPGIRVRVFARDRDERFREVPMVLDTLFVNTDEGRVSLTWRGLDAVLESDLTDMTSAMVISEALAAAPQPAANFEPILAEFEEMRPGFDELDEDVREKFEAAIEAKGKMAEAVEESAGGVPDVAKMLAPLAAFLPMEQIDAISQMADAGREATEDAEAQVNVGAMLADAISPASPPPPPAMPLGPDHLPLPPMEEHLNKIVEMVAQQSEVAEARGVEIHGLQAFYEGLQNPALALVAPNFVPPKVPGSEDDEAPKVDAPQIDPVEELNDMDLRDRNFAGADLENANLSNSDLTGVSLAGANLTNARLTGAKLAGADFTGANLKRTILIQADAAGALFDGASLYQTSFGEANLAEASFKGIEAFQSNFVAAELAQANFSQARFHQCDLSNAKLAGANFSKADLQRSILMEAQAEGACFDEAEISLTSFMKANLVGASLQFATGSSMSFQAAILDGANFTRCVFRSALMFEASAKSAIFRHADLRGARLYRTQLQGADLVEMNLFEADLSRAALAGASLEGSNLYGAFLNKVDLEEVDLTDVDLKHVVQLPA